MSADIGLIGLAVMGENLVLNMERNGFTVAVYNRTTARVDEFVSGRGKDKKVRTNCGFAIFNRVPRSVLFEFYRDFAPILSCTNGFLVFHSLLLATPSRLSAKL